MSRTLDWTAHGDKASFPVFFRFRITQTDNQCKCFIIVRVCRRQNGLQITYYIVGYIKEYPSTNMHMNRYDSFFKGCHIVLEADTTVVQQ